MGCGHLPDGTYECSCGHCGEVIGVEEGATCNRANCRGIIRFSRSENCSCHISAPCPSCMEVHLECPVCGWRDEEKP